MAATGFAAGAGAYQDARPGWPPEVVDQALDYWGLDPAGGLVVDVAAGTGSLTRLLAGRCPRLIAVEPVAEMRAHIRDAEAVAATAERLPLDDGSVLAIFVAEAFHWFDQHAALTEFARVLRPGGALAVMWNNALFDGDEAQARARASLRELVAPHVYHPMGLDFFRRDMREERAWQTGPGWDAFEPLAHRELFHEQAATRESTVALVGSWSFVARLDEPTRKDVLRRADRLLRDHGVDNYRQRWRCDLYLTRRR